MEQPKTIEIEKLLNVATRSYAMAMERYFTGATINDQTTMIDSFARSSAISVLIQDLGIMSRDEFKNYIGGQNGN